MKPCPFCGGEPELMGVGATSEEGACWWVGCHTCGCSQGVDLLDDSGAEAIEAWNRRAQPAQAVPLLSRKDAEKLILEAGGIPCGNGAFIAGSINSYRLVELVEQAVRAKEGASR